MLGKINIGEHYTIPQYKEILETEEKKETFEVEKYLNYKKMLEKKIGVSLNKLILDDNCISAIISFVHNECNKCICNYNCKCFEFIKNIERNYGISCNINYKCKTINKAEEVYVFDDIYKEISNSFISCIEKIRQIVGTKKDSKYYELEIGTVNNTLDYIKNVKALENIIRCTFVVNN